MPSSPLPQEPSQHAERSDGDSDYGPIDLGLHGGSFAPSFSYGADVSRKEADEVDALLKEWTTIFD